MQASDFFKKCIELNFPANDVVFRLRQMSEDDVRSIVRYHAGPLALRVCRAIEIGEAQRDPQEFAKFIVANDEAIQYSIVWCGTYLNCEEIDRLVSPSLLAACSEVIDFARCVHSDERLTAIIGQELRKFLPALAEVAQ